MKIFISVFSFVLFFITSTANIAKADSFPAWFIEKYKVVLAQFIADSQISAKEFRDLDFTVAQERKSGAKFFLIYRPPQRPGANPRYYYLIDRNTSAADLLMDVEREYVPMVLLPDWLLDESITFRGTKEVDFYAYFGEIDPVEVRLYNLRTINGYEIKMDRYSHHRPGANLLRGDNETERLSYLRENYPQHFDRIMEAGGVIYRPSYHVTGNIKATDIFTPDERVKYLAKTQIAKIQQESTSEYRQAVLELGIQVNAFYQRYNAIYLKKELFEILNNSKGKKSAYRCETLLGSLSF